MSKIRVAVAAIGLFVAGNAQANPDGEQVFRRSCSICHSVEANKNRVGPSLAGVVGRPASSIPDFSYSDANKQSGVVWTAETLDTYLTNPRAFMPGTRMTFPGLQNPDDRQAVIAFLKAH